MGETPQDSEPSPVATVAVVFAIALLVRGDPWQHAAVAGLVTAAVVWVVSVLVR
jgi:hypothetical protein